MLGKFSYTQKVIMVGICILIVVVVVLRINVSRLRGPYYQFEDAINAGDVTKACKAYARINGSAKTGERAAAEKMADKYVRIVISDYLTGAINYEKASKEVYEIRDGILKDNAAMDDYISKMEYWHEAEENFRLGIEAKEDGLYEESVKYFSKIPPDYNGYDEALIAIQEVEDLKEARARKVIEDAMNTVDLNDDIHTYLDAIELLDGYIADYPDDNFVSARREQFVDEYYNLQLKNIEALLSAKEDEMALSIAKELKELNPKRKEAQDYIEQLQK